MSIPSSQLKIAPIAPNASVDGPRNLIDGDDNTTYKATALRKLATTAGRLGHWTKAANHLDQAIYILRQLYAKHPSVYQTDLSRALYNLGIYLGRLGSHLPARDALYEAIELQRALFTTNPEPHRIHLAQYLFSFGICLSKLNRYLEARKATHEAIEHQRILTLSDSNNIHSSQLANSLYNLAIYSGIMRSYTEARDAALEALAVRRTLYIHDPAKYCSDVANSLFTLGTYCGELERHAEAREALLEAVGLRSRLYITNPDDHIQLLANSLFALSNCYRRLAEQQFALRTAKEAVQLQRRVSADDSMKHRAKLAEFLHHLAICFDACADTRHSEPPILEAVELRRVLHTIEPTVYRPCLLQSLQYLSTVFHRLGDYRKARTTVAEIVSLQRESYIQHPHVYRVDFFNALYQLRYYLQLRPGLSSFQNPNSQLLDVDREAVLLLDRSADVQLVPGQKVGEGGFGTVHLAEWKSSSSSTWWGSDVKRLIVKMLNGMSANALHALSSPGSSAPNTSLYRELIVSFRVGVQPHRNVVGHLGYIIHNDEIGLVSPYFVGGNASEYIAKTPEANLQSLCWDVAVGLHHLHNSSEPIVHGDLKPANVIVDEEGRAALCDFGLSRLMSIAHDVHQRERGRVIPRRSGLTTMTLGTLRYCASEIVRDDGGPTLESDVYSFACTCGEMLSGQPPFAQFTGSSAMQKIIDALMSRSPPPPYDIQSITSLYPDFSILAECWSPNPLKRPSMNEVCKRMGWWGDKQTKALWDHEEGMQRHPPRSVQGD